MATKAHVQTRLHLSHEMYVDVEEDLPHHVINSVRFLFKQYVKNKPGVILNDPPGYNQELPVALFLQAVHNACKQSPAPVLIMCRSEKLEDWKECLMNYIPDFEAVVAVDWPRPSSKKSIYLITTDRLDNYYRRNWGFAVVDDDFLQYKLPPGNLFNVLFKIFITTDELRENLQKFAQIHKWLYPDVKIDVDEFRPNKNSISDILKKRMYFAAFVHDTLIRNDNNPIQIPENEYRDVNKKLENRITRKNKDASGTKIKRTKRKLCALNFDSEMVSKKMVAADNDIDICINNDSKLDLSNNISNDTSNMDVESFIRDQEPLKMDELDYMSNIDYDMSNTSKNMDVSEVKSDTDLLDEKDMKNNYEKLPLTTDDDSAYYLETQELDTKDLETKESNENIEINADDANDFDIEESKCEKPVHREVEDDIKNGDSESKDTQIENKLESKDSEVKPDVKENGLNKKDMKAEDLDSKWEEMALKKFKGSLLDRIF